MVVALTERAGGGNVHTRLNSAAFDVMGTTWLICIAHNSAITSRLVVALVVAEVDGGAT